MRFYLRGVTLLLAITMGGVDGHPAWAALVAACAVAAFLVLSDNR